MIFHKTARYKRSAVSLPKKIQYLLKQQETLLSENIFHPKLHTKKLKGLSGENVFSFRVTREYRGLFRLERSEIILFMIDRRKDIYRSL